MSELEKEGTIALVPGHFQYSYTTKPGQYKYSEMHIIRTTMPSNCILIHAVWKYIINVMVFRVCVVWSGEINVVCSGLI